MEKNYNQGKIYKIVCNITNEIYIGSTIQDLNNRLASHKIRKSCMSKQIIERGDYEIILIKNYPCNSKYELEEEEAKYIRENECINKTIPHRTRKEWREENKEKIIEYKKEYYEDNKEKINKKTNEYYKNNKEKIVEQKKTFYENNKEKQLQIKKKYYEDNKEVINKQRKEQVLCECGILTSKNHISRHRKSKRHIKFLEEKSI